MAWMAERTCRRCCSIWATDGSAASIQRTPTAGKEPSQQVYDSIVAAQAAAQPFVYPTGLVEVPMSPISDIGAFRGGRWKLEWFLKAIRLAVEWTIEHRACFDFLSHPSCLYAMDPKFQAIDLICELVVNAKGKARLADSTALAASAKR